MARRSRKSARKERLDGSPNHQQAQPQPTEVNAEKPQLLYPEMESTVPKDPEIKMEEQKMVKKIEGEERNEPNQLCNEPDSTPSKETITKSLTNLDSEHHELCPKLDPLCPKASNPVLLPESERVVVKNGTNGLSTEPNPITPRKKKRKKRKSLSTTEGAETNDVHYDHCELSPNLDPLPPKDSDPLLLPEPEPVAEKNETDQLCTEPESATPRRKKRKKRKSLSAAEGAETNDLHFDHCELIPNLYPLPPKDSDPVLLLEPEPVAEKNESNQLCTEPESATPRKKKRKKRKGLSTAEGAETNDVHSEHYELIPNLDPLSPKDSDPVLLHEPEPVADKIETNELCTEPESATPSKTKRKRKRKSLSRSEATETNHVDPGHLELCPNLDPLPPKDSDAVLLPQPEPVAEKNETNQLCTEPESATPMKTKRKKKRKRKSLSKSEGTETYHVDSGYLELCPNLDPLPLKDSDTVLLPEPEPFAEKNETNLLCTEPESATPGKTKRKRKRKSLSKSEGTERNHVDSGHLELCPNLEPLPQKDSDSVLLPAPEPFAEKKETNQLCTKPDPTRPKFEGAEINDMDSGNLVLFPKVDQVPPKDSDPLLLPESQSAPPKEVEQKKKGKKKKKKKKNKGELKGEGVESNKSNDEHSQQCHKAKPTTPEKPNQRNRKRQESMATRRYNLRPRGAVQSMVTHMYNSRPIRACTLNSEVVESGPRVPKWPLRDYERYERCLECGQICEGDQRCSGRRHYLKKYKEICFFCGMFGHPLGRCPISPGTKCANGIIMLDDYVRKKCSEKSGSTYQKVAPANLPTSASYYTHFLPSNIQPYPPPFFRPMYAPFVI